MAEHLEGLNMPEHISLAAIDTRVSVLEKDVGEINDRLIGLDDKFDKVMSGFATEFRTAVAGLSTQFSERNKTPWGILISGAGVVVTLVAVLGHQALTPLADNITALTMEIKSTRTDLVPRSEVEFRYVTTARRLEMIEQELRTTHQHEIESLQQEVKSLRSQNDLLKLSGARKD